MEEHSEINYGFDEYLDRLHLYLDQHNLRKTYERNLILHTIYHFKEHFTLDMLHKFINEKKPLISRTTIYHTLNLLVDAGLVIKHHFPSQVMPQYEKLYHISTHNHICLKNTNEIVEFSDSRIDEIIKNIEETYNVTVLRHSFIVYCNSKNEKSEKENQSK